MKALKFLSVFLFSLAMVGCFHVSAYAAEVETDSDYIFLSPEEISMEDVEQSTLIASQTFTAIFDENGGLVDVIEGICLHRMLTVIHGAEHPTQLQCNFLKVKSPIDIMLG